MANKIKPKQLVTQATVDLVKILVEEKGSSKLSVSKAINVSYATVCRIAHANYDLEKYRQNILSAQRKSILDRTPTSALETVSVEEKKEETVSVTKLLEQILELVKSMEMSSKNLFNLEAKKYQEKKDWIEHKKQEEINYSGRRPRIFGR